MKKLFIVLLLSLLSCQFSMGQIGTWKAYMAYYDIQQIQDAGDDLFVMASNDLYQYNKQDQSIVTYDKVNGLSDTNIKKIRWCQQAKRLIVIYENLNIDLVETNGNIINISDIYTKAITGDKTLKSMYLDGVYAYLVCGFGIVKVNVKKAEIADTYRPGHPDYPSTIPTDTDTDYEDNIDLVRTLQPGGPKSNHFGFMTYKYGKLYTSSGMDWDGCIQILDDNEWIFYQDTYLEEITGLKTYNNVRTLAIDPHNQNHVYAGSRNGLYEFLNGKLIKHYHHTNSPIEPFDGKSEEYQLVYSAYYDQNHNVWCLNSQAPTKSLLRLDLDNNQWTSYNLPNLMAFDDGGLKNKSLPYMEKMKTDSRNIIWFVNDYWTKASIHRLTFDSDGNPVCKSIFSFVNQNGVRIDISGGVHDIVEDMNKDLWIATSEGPLLLKKDQINEDDPVFTQVIVPRNDGTDYGDYLLAGINITCMDIDSGNRKWFGTKGNGVFVISDDNMSQIHHFTSENSPILSNNILSLAINQKTGEVYIGTEVGLCSFKSDASTPNETMTTDNVWAYPNPVTPDYTGLITITGLSFNADVKILNANGKLMAEGKSNGGTFTWDGCDKDGNRVASGVYMVATATRDGNKGTVCKIAIVR